MQKLRFGVNAPCSTVGYKFSDQLGGFFAFGRFHAASDVQSVGLAEIEGFSDVVTVQPAGEDPVGVGERGGVFLTPGGEGGPVELFSPASEVGAGVGVEKQGDREIGPFADDGLDFCGRDRGGR